MDAASSPDVVSSVCGSSSPSAMLRSPMLSSIFSSTIFSSMTLPAIDGADSEELYASGPAKSGALARGLE